MIGVTAPQYFLNLFPRWQAGLGCFNLKPLIIDSIRNAPEVNWPTLDIRVVSNLEGQNERDFIYSVPGIKRFAATKGKRWKNSSSFQHSG